MEPSARALAACAAQGGGGPGLENVAIRSSRGGGRGVTFGSSPALASKHCYLQSKMPAFWTSLPSQDLGGLVRGPLVRPAKDD
ncbi:hypothetical protein GGTG_11791 [Gaeumannomyces tritici R3-111a-1]|uniref:Uncharacterized protein n=1 Tax=Gaeumannomyces tritici (strain R3-111a-1) TaxID=644352 RepID=J3PE68_GAET3|nr:hypothetical protein GGTG_11791 [Gaeumannomyces tritici R3-111a-1]EJT70768.1 hypothetical protein GGTG_11791 [Gaeumannomyces tritici R3-111a-1]